MPEKCFKKRPKWQFQRNFRKYEINFKSYGCELLVTAHALTLTLFYVSDTPSGDCNSKKVLSCGF